MKSADIRSSFISYFTRNGHTPVASSSLIPAQDPTLLFANAGMNQFKDCFLGKETRSYTRAVSIQKCVRAGGKHNDLDNVGFTKRHLTFFEMMGNFSFGDYFKKEAIVYAWEFLTQELKLDIINLHATVYKTDDESYDFWHTMIGLPKGKIHRLGEKENFWQMGDVGPCGPCTEIHIDRGLSFSQGCPDPKLCSPACDCDRFLEIWNLVFMQYDRQANGDLVELSHKGVDTGMGLERLCAVMQNVDSVFHTDIFYNTIKEIERISGIIYAQAPVLTQNAFHVLADHIRSATFLIADGCSPSNDGRGYVLRKIIRRAALFAQKISDDKNLFPLLSKVIVDDFGTYYPDLLVRKDLVYRVLESEVDKFALNLIRGQQILERYFIDSEYNRTITGQQTFKLYDTYGFPLELVILMAHEKGYAVDEKAFEQCMDEQRLLSGKKISHDPLDSISFEEGQVTEFTGYRELITIAPIIGLVHDAQLVNFVSKGTDCYIITARSPFFIVGGGQVPDQGWVEIDGHRVSITQARYINNRIAVRLIAPVDIVVGQEAVCMVDKRWRTNAMKNHTGTHLLQAALIQVLGNTVKQSGSLVHPDYLRFDFTYHNNLTLEQIKEIEDIVNNKIMANIAVITQQLTMKEALDQGALAFFGDKYNPDEVRMVKIDDFSVELCGGTHVPDTGVIGLLKIVEVSALSAGHKRIVAVTGPKALALFQETYGITKQLCQEFAIQQKDIIPTVIKLENDAKQLEQEIMRLKRTLLLQHMTTWEKQVEQVHEIPVLVLCVEDADMHVLREINNNLNQKKPGLYITLTHAKDKTTFLITLDERYKKCVQISLFASWLKEQYGWRAGGKDGVLQGGGQMTSRDVVYEIREWIRNNANPR